MKVVLDTSVVISALVFKKGRLDFIRDLYQGGKITPLGDAACISELIRALGYAKFRLSSDEIEHLLQDYLPFVQVLDAPPAIDKYARCTELHDRKFLALAGAGGAAVLVSSDRALLRLSGDFDFAIESPAVFAKRWK